MNRVLAAARLLHLRVERSSSGAWRFTGPGGVLRARTLRDVDVSALPPLARRDVDIEALLRDDLMRGR